MNLSMIRFPRQMEADGTAERVRCVLAGDMRKLWPGGVLHVPAMEMSVPLKDAITGIWLKGNLQCGYEAISDQLENEKRGIDHARKARVSAQENRISRLLLFSNDGAERLYRHIEQLLQRHESRLMGCLLNVDSHVLGRLASGRERQIKVVMVEHKLSVAMALRAMIQEG